MHPAQSWTGTDGPQLPALPAPQLDSRSQAGSLTGGHCPSPSASLGPVLSQTPRSVFWVPCLPPRCFPPHPASLLSQFPSVSLCCLFVICFPCVSLFPLLTLFSTFLFLSLCALASVPRMNTFPLSEASGALGSWSSQVGARALLGLGLSQPGAALPCPPGLYLVSPVSQAPVRPSLPLVMFPSLLQPHSGPVGLPSIFPSLGLCALSPSVCLQPLSRGFSVPCSRAAQ